MGHKRWMRESDPSEPLHSHVRISELENALSKKNQPYGNPDKNGTFEPDRSCEEAHFEITATQTLSCVMLIKTSI
jgi:hypothetical protein